MRWFALVLASGIAALWLALPLRFEVEGLSMAPGIMPGDVVPTGWCPCRDRWRSPRRFECWTLTAPDGTAAVKRVVGLPGEEIGFHGGDLVADGDLILKPPRLLAAMALAVPAAAWEVSPTAARLVLDSAVHDDVPFADDERRLLVPVDDVGLAATVRLPSFSSGPVVVTVEVADRAARVRLARPGRYLVVSGRLDGRFVAGAWPTGLPRRGHEGCPAVPADAAWGVESPWGRSGSVGCMAVRIGTDEAPAGELERVVAWRDVHLLPPADGTAHWRLHDGEWFVIGDFPGGSRDSRHWGAIPRHRLQHRLAAVTR